MVADKGKYDERGNLRSSSCHWWHVAAARDTAWLHSTMRSALQSLGCGACPQARMMHGNQLCVVAATGLNVYPTLVSFTPNITTRELTY